MAGDLSITGSAGAAQARARPAAEAKMREKCIPLIKVEDKMSRCRYESGYFNRVRVLSSTEIRRAQLSCDSTQASDESDLKDPASARRIFDSLCIASCLYHQVPSTDTSEADGGKLRRSVGLVAKTA